MTCPRCQQENPPESNFCLGCGTRLAPTCGACGTNLPAGARFCNKCGTPVDAPPSAPRFPSPDAYTPRHLAERILTSRTALEGERKQVTVLFADLKGSMELLADRDPEEARRILDPVLERMMEAVHRYEGTVNQVMGDGIMALFGAPLAHEDHAVRACYAALRMHEGIRRYSEEARRTVGVEVQVRVGLNSGDVVVRTIGSDLHMDYTAVGQTTHLAARMEQLAPPGTTRLTAETLRLAEGFVQVKPLGPIPVKGLAEPALAFELTGAAGARTRLQAAHARGFTRFVGRDAEMEQLEQARAQAAGGRGQVVAVVGDAGVGKSRLYHEFIHSHRTEGWLVLAAGSVSYGKATPFGPLADLLRAYFHIGDGDDPRAVRAKVTGTVLTLDRALEDSVAPLAWLLDAEAADDPPAEPAQRRARAIEAAKRVLLRESRVQPLVLVFEDLHWIDAETQGFLDGLVDSLPTHPVVLCVNYRPEYRHGWGHKTYYRQLRIDPLPPASARELLDGLLGDDASVQPLKPMLISRTEGNPLFLEESVRTLLETGGLVGERGDYRLARPAESIQVPATVQAILAARIDRLRPELKRLLQAASVIGKDVPVVLLEALAEVPEGDLRAGLAELQTAEFLYEARLFPDLEYTFKHALTHEVAYGGVLQDRRRMLHGAIVEAIERRYGARLAEHVEALAHHAARGGLGDKAARYLRQAGDKAMARSAGREAIAFYEQALAILGERPETPETLSDALDLWIALGPAQISLEGAGAPRVEEIYRRALALVERLGDPSRRFPVFFGQWFISYTVGRYADALAAGERLLEDARAGDDTGRLVEAHHAMWPTLLAMGQTAAAIPYMEAGIALYRREAHAGQAFLYAGHDPGACCRYQMACARWLLGYPEHALALARDARRLAAELEHPHTATVTLWFSAWVEYQCGDHEALGRTVGRLRELAEPHGFVPWLDSALVLPHVGGPPLPAERLGAVHRALVGVRTAAWRRVFCLLVLAQLCVDAGQGEQGLEVLASIGPADREAHLAPEILRLEGDLLRLRDAGADEAERRLRAAIDLARIRAEKSLELRATTSLARLLAERGRRDEACGLLADAYGWFTEGFDTRDLRAARALLAELRG